MNMIIFENQIWTTSDSFLKLHMKLSHINCYVKRT